MTDIPPKRWYLPTSPHGAATQKTNIDNNKENYFLPPTLHRIFLVSSQAVNKRILSFTILHTYVRCWTIFRQISAIMEGAILFKVEFVTEVAMSCLNLWSFVALVGSGVATEDTLTATSYLVEPHFIKVKHTFAFGLICLHGWRTKDRWWTETQAEQEVKECKLKRGY
jgi:hypothetical protein